MDIDRLIALRRHLHRVHRVDFDCLTNASELEAEHVRGHAAARFRNVPDHPRTDMTVSAARGA